MRDGKVFEEISDKAAGSAPENSETSMDAISLALAVDAKVALVYIRRAMFYLKEGMFDAMESVLDVGIAVVPDNGVLLLMRRDSDNYRIT